MTFKEITIALRNVTIGSNLYSFTLRKPRKIVSYASECLFLARQLHPNGDLPQVQVWDHFGIKPTLPVVLAGDAGDSEWFRPIASYTVDLIAMCMLCQIVKPSVIFEIGTYHGSGALHWALNAPTATVYTLDLPPQKRPELHTTVVDQYHIRERSTAESTMVFAGRPEAERIRCLLGDSARFDFAPYFQRVDLFFVDGAHSYEYVTCDTRSALACCKPGGVIAWHDYGRSGVNGVSKVLHKLAANGYPINRVPGGSLAYTRKNLGADIGRNLPDGLQSAP
jgi:predicted O-methyltransferase YrrM